MIAIIHEIERLHKIQMKNVHFVGTRSDKQFASQNPIQGNFSQGEILIQCRVLLDVFNFVCFFSLLRYYMVCVIKHYPY